MVAMRKIIVGIFILLSCMMTYAQTPSWITEHPVSSTAYIGIGFAPISDPDYIKKATQNALSDIVSQIAIKLENNSLLQRIDVDGHSREMLEDEIRNNAEAWIEGHELTDSYQTKSRYYVCYTLNKESYAKKAAIRRNQAIRTGMDYLQKGQKEELSMNLSQAAFLYIKGLESIEEWAFMDLTTTIDGRSVNIPIELYNACINLFSGMSITTNVKNVDGEEFKAITKPIAACLSKNGIVIPNFKIKASFIKGSGVITPAIETDYTGTAEFYVTNITSKDEVQELRFEIDESPFKSIPIAYQGLFFNQSLPSAKITITLKNSPISAYFSVSDNHDLTGIENSISSLLSNQHFSFTENPKTADCYIELSTKLDIGEVVTGGTNDLNTYYCSLRLKIYNNKNEELLLDYLVTDVKVLYPINKSVSESISTCIREMMKRVNKDLPTQIKKLKIK